MLRAGATICRTGVLKIDKRAGVIYRLMDNRWVSLGPDPQLMQNVAEGGRATCIAFAPPSSSSGSDLTLEPLLYVGTFGGGIFRSRGLRFNDTSALSWKPTSDRFPLLDPVATVGIGLVHAIAVAASDPAMVYASTDAGVIMTNDAAQTWKVVTTSITARRMLVDPTTFLPYTVWSRPASFKPADHRSHGRCLAQLYWVQRTSRCWNSVCRPPAHR